MANKFEVQIVALDRFTKTFRDLNNKASRATRPLVNVQRQIGSLAREMHLDKAAKGVGKLSDATLTLTRTLGLSLGPLESVLGAGGIVGGLLAAGGAAVALGVRVGNIGFEVARTSQAIGVSTKDLQLWRGAAELAGVDADVMTQTLAGMGRTLQNARFGRDSDALNALRALGIGIPLKNGVVDQVAALEGISRALARITDPQVRATLAEKLHIPPEALPALIQGAENLDRLRQRAKELGVELDENTIKKANELTTSINLLKVATQGAGNELGSSLVGPLSQAVDYMTKMITLSSRSRFEGAKEGMTDMLLSGPRSVRWAAHQLFGGSEGTTPAQRTVSGLIGGPLHQGPYVAPPAGASSAPAGYGNDSQMRQAVAFTPEEMARMQAGEDTEANRRELMREIQRTRNPGARAVLQDTLTQMEQRMHVEITFKNAPPGVTATARVASADGGRVSTRVQYAMPTGDMP